MRQQFQMKSGREIRFEVMHNSWTQLSDNDKAGGGGSAPPTTSQTITITITLTIEMTITIAMNMTMTKQVERAQHHQQPDELARQ